ncbi:MAG: isochorismate synthase [Tannerellaceae bacterium]|nr:isochorismate synthase [Tannerellaceae bacterium]
MTSDQLRIVDELIRHNCSFALYRIPGETVPHFLMQTAGDAECIHTIEDLNNQTGFVIAPFEISERCPIIIIRPDCWELPNQPASFSSALIPEEACGPAGTEKTDYERIFSLFLFPLKNKELDKLVLSRHITLARKTDFSPAKAFSMACERYIRSYVYLCHTPQTGTWLGSTPEILLSGEGPDWHTVALAGTQPLLQGELPTDWDEKNREEQQLVARYIQEKLLSFGIHPAEEGPYTVRAGELAHLKTDFRFSLPDNSHLGNLLELLHPTPAICGLPKEKAFKFILQNEGHERKYYSGFIGWMDPAGKSDLYVNLRCMQLRKETLTLYAGSGLLSSSTLEEEWKETADKLQTMLAITR